MGSGETRHGLGRRRLLQAGAGAGLTLAGIAGSGSAARAGTDGAGRSGTGRPGVEFGDGNLDATLGGAYRAGLTNLLDVNTVRYDPTQYNRTGLMTDPPGVFIRAGGGYEQPWTRDASTNSWNAASLLSPDAARNTLWSVCDRQPDGTLIVLQDNQWWDQIIWAVAAWRHYLVTGDREFLADAHQAAANTLAANQSHHYNAEYGLFEGPAFMQDGIAGYPSSPYEQGNDSSFVLDHSHADRLLCLSTNCLYYAGYQALAAMAGALGVPDGGLRGRAARLRAAINRRLWRRQAGTYGYLIHGAGPLAGHLEPYQEAAGLAFAVLFGVASRAQTRSILATTHHAPHGVVNVWPSLPRFDAAHPGRHNAIVWPMVVGMWGHAAAAGGRGDLFAQAVTDVAGLVGGDGHYWELYNAGTGEVDGGWQVGRHWPSEPDQTWSATGYLRLLHAGLFGFRFGPHGLRLAPQLPAGWGPVRLRDLPYRRMTLDITVSGVGDRISSCEVDSRPVLSATVPAGLAGRHRVRVQLRR